MDGGHPYCTKTIITNNNIEVNPSYTIWVQQNNILMSTLTASFSIQVSSLINGCTLKVLPLHLLVAQGSNPHATSARAARSVHCFAQHYYGCCQRQQVMHVEYQGTPTTMALPPKTIFFSFELWILARSENPAICGRNRANFFLLEKL